MTYAAQEAETPRLLDELASLRQSLAASESREARLRGALDAAKNQLYHNWDFLCSRAFDYQAKHTEEVYECVAGALSSTPSPELLGALRTLVKELQYYANVWPDNTSAYSQHAIKTLRDLGPCLERYGVGNE